jgi:hypothetical protein
MGRNKTSPNSKYSRPTTRKQTELLGFLDEMDAIVTGYQTEVDQEVSNAVFEIYTLAETLGLASSDTVESMIAELEDYFSGVREAEKRLALRYDEDGWLLAWLQRNQGFVNDNLGGEIPAWVLNR